MNNIYRKLILILLIFSVFIGMYNVNAESFIGKIDTSGDTSNGGGSGGSGGAPKNGRQTIAHGYRISLINSTTGVRAPNTYSVDYWSKNYRNSKGVLISGYGTLLGLSNYAYKTTPRCVFNDQKLTRQELLNKSNSYSCGVNKSNTAFFDNKYNKKNEDMKLSNGSMVFDETGGSNNGSYVYTSAQIADKTSGNYFAYDAGMAISENFFEKDTKSSDYDWAAINQYIVNCGYKVSDDAKLNVQSAANSNYILQLEPISAMVMDGNVYVGSMAELFKMWHAKKWYTSWYTDVGSVNSGGFSKYTDLYPVLYANGTGTIANINLSDGSGLLLTSENNYNNSGLGVALFQLSKIKVGCTDASVKSVYSQYYGKNNYDEKIKDACGTDDCSHLYSNNLVNYGINNVDLVTCKVPTCNDVANNRKNTINEIRASDVKAFYDNAFIKILSGLDGYDAGNIYDNTILKAYAYNQSLYSSTTDLCEPIECQDLLENGTRSDEKLAKLFTIFGKNGKNDFLNPEILKPLFGDQYLNKAKCGVSIPICPPSGDKNISCSNNNIFTLSDNRDPNCIQTGIAYNNKETSNDAATVLQSSFDAEYGTASDPGTCEESVSFNFPTSISKDTPVIAGTVMKWGTNTNKDSNLFGTMTITRKCYLSESAKEKSTFEIGSKWANVNDGDSTTYYYNTNSTEYVNEDTGRINPKITLVYEQMVPGDIDITNRLVSEELGVYLYEYKGTTNNKLDEDHIIYDSNGNMIAYYENNEEIDCSTGNCKKPSDGLRSITCKNNCNSIDHVTMVATYKIVYKDELKWFADKSNNGELLTYESDNYKSNSSSYLFAGYGLPTSFITPSNYNCTNSSSTTESGSSSNIIGKNLISVEVNQVGTKNNDGTYHFNKFVKNFITDDNNSDQDNINYICNYHIKNKLFDNESNSSSPLVCTPPDRTPKGIDVVFRTVDLISDADHVGDAFPGRSGTGRTLGANWAKYESTEIAQVLSTDVDNQQDPMYYIKLDSPTIQMIREWNNAAREQGIDPYTYMGEPKTSVKEDPGYGYTGYIIEDKSVKVNNEDITYKFVQSRFLTMLSNRLDDDHYLSICVNGDTHILNCNQSWWKEETDDKNTITINITEKSIEE